MKVKQTLLPALALLISFSAVAQWQTQILLPVKTGIFAPIPSGKDVMWLTTGVYLGPDLPNGKPLEYIRTFDGGKTYVSGKLFDNDNDYSPEIRSIGAGDTAFMIAAALTDTVSNSLQKTVDGGKTWTKLAFVPETFPDLLYFFNQKEGAYVGDGDSLGLVFKYTTDGGATFTRVPPSSLPAPLSGEYSIQDENSILGNTIFIPGVGDEGYRIWRTTDKGRHWTAGAIFTNIDGFSPRFSFADSLHGMMIRGIATVRQQPLYTLDGGATWQESVGTLPGEAAYPIAALPGTQTFMALFGDRTRNKLFSALTNDYGKTWNTYKDVAPYTLDSIYVPSRPPFDFSNLEIYDNHHA